MSITRDVVSDLWPLYSAGEASADTRALVEDYLRSDPEFARRLQAPLGMPAAEIAPAPDAEARALARTRDLLNGRSWLRGLRLVALVLTGLAFARALEHTSWDAGTRRWVATASVAAVAWLLYVALLRRYRVQALRGTAARSTSV
jgi:hypothetical protein